MNNEKFDRMLSEIRSEQLDDHDVGQAGQRVWNSITAAAPASDFAGRTLRTCEDFQALIPGYLTKQLATARASLFEDHVHACVACRHALEHARHGELQNVWRVEPKRRPVLAWGWLMGAAAVVAAIFAVIAFTDGMFPGQHLIRASVQSVDGSLYSGSGANMRLIPAGYQIKNGDEIRTANRGQWCACSTGPWLRWGSVQIYPYHANGRARRFISVADR